MSASRRPILRTILLVILCAFSAGCSSVSQFVGLEKGHILVTYYAPAWGPNTNGDEVVYFLKQVEFESGSELRTRIYFCSIKPDGTDRKEIAWLWKDQPDQFFENFSSAVTMDVNAATRRAAIGIEYGGRTGVFVVNLGGTGLTNVWAHEWATNRPTNASNPTWSPDGQWIAFVEWQTERGYDFRQIVKCRPDGSGYTRLTERDGYEINIQPAWSPTTNLIAYVHYPNHYPGGRYLWLMKPDGTEKRDTKQWGDSPRWSPDAKFILHDTYSVIDPVSGELIRRYPFLEDRQGIQMYPKWGKSGFVFVDYLKIGFTNLDGDKTVALLKNVSHRGTLSDMNTESSRW